MIHDVFVALYDGSWRTRQTELEQKEKKYATGEVRDFRNVYAEIRESYRTRDLSHPKRELYP